MDFKGIMYGGKKMDVNDQQAREMMQKTKDMITDAFSEEKPYAAGDYCIYNNTFYKFTAEKDVGPWNPETVQNTTIAAEFSGLNSKIGGLKIIAGDVSFGEITGNVSKTVDVTFPYPFDDKPFVITGLVGGIHNNDSYDGTICAAYNIGPTGFSAQIKNASPRTIAPAIHYIACG